MSLPTKKELKSVITRLLTRAQEEDRLDQLTVRIVLRELVTHYDVEEDVFQSEEYKPFIKSTVFETIRSFEGGSDGDAGASKNKGGRGGISESNAKAGKRKRQTTRPSNGEPGEDAGISRSEAQQSKKASAPSRPSKTRGNQTVEKPTKSGKTSKKPESESKFKSKAIIDSSDEGAGPPVEMQKSAGSLKKNKASKKSSPSKLKQWQRKVDDDDSDVEMEAGEGLGPSSSAPKSEPVTELPKPSVSRVNESIRDPMDSELSSVIDEPPTKRKKKQEKMVAKPQKDEKIKRGKKEPLSKDEETVNKLKGIVLACGVHKVWKKEFEGLDRPSQQTKRLHSILADLGMTPRYSLEKARVIREQRELAQELKDVQEFDRAIKRRGKGLPSSSGTGESMDEGSSDNVPTQKKQTARASIMAFLQDQSEEE